MCDEKIFVYIQSVPNSNIFCSYTGSGDRTSSASSNCAVTFELSPVYLLYLFNFRNMLFVGLTLSKASLSPHIWTNSRPTNFPIVF